MACSTPPKLVPQGGECFQATDCADGLVCLPEKAGHSTCDSDVGRIQKTEDAAPPRSDAGRDGGGDGGDGGDGRAGEGGRRNDGAAGDAKVTVDAVVD